MLRSGFQRVKTVKELLSQNLNQNRKVILYFLSRSSKIDFSCCCYRQPHHKFPKDELFAHTLRNESQFSARGLSKLVALQVFTLAW